MPDDATSISIEEANRIRLSLGLKPLRVDPEPSADSSAQPPKPAEDDNSIEAQERRAVENWHKLKAEQEEAARKKSQKEETRREIENYKRFKQLEGKGLADDDEEEDALSWVRKQKKRQKKIAKKMAEDLAARDDQAVKEYTEKDVRDLRVAHDMDDIMARGEEGAILTLKDATIDELEEEGDELEDVALAEKERLEEKLRLIKKKPAYNVHEETDELGNKQTILSQYDEEIEGKKKKRFVLGEALTAEQKAAAKAEVAEKVNKLTAVSMDMDAPQVINDYIDPSEIKVRKLKKKKKANKRQRLDDEEDLVAPGAAAEDASAMDVDDGEPAKRAPKRIAEDISFIDDDDLQSALKSQRRNALKRRKILKPEELAKQLKEEEEANGAGEDADSPVKDEEAGLVIDETSEFVAHLQAPVTAPRRKAPEPISQPDEASPEPLTALSPDGDVDMEDTASHATFAPTSMGSTPSTKDARPALGLEEEATLDRGIGATLKMLSQRGLLAKNPEIEEQNKLFRERQKFQTEKKLKQLEAEKRAKQQRERDRASGKFDRMSAREREEHARWENKQRDLAEARDVNNKFKDYKPDVKLEYKDEFGRDLTPKEAFKHLSHQFHGKGSGKAKTEKRLKKIEDERKREAASTLNPSTQGMSSSMAATAKRSKQAGVRLM